jgi:hypothetical protein
MMMKYPLLAAAAMATFAAIPAMVGLTVGCIVSGGSEDHARIEPSKTLDLIRRIKDAGGEVFAS